MVDLSTSSPNPKPKFFCGDSLWIESNRYYDLATGQDSGRSWSQVTGGATTKGLWSPKLRTYTPIGSLCKDQPVMFGYTLNRVQAIVLCPRTFNAIDTGSIPTLNNLKPPNVIPEKKSLQHFQSWGSTLLHELAHLLVPESESCTSFICYKSVLSCIARWTASLAF